MPRFPENRLHRVIDIELDDLRGRDVDGDNDNDNEGNNCEAEQQKNLFNSPGRDLRRRRDLFVYLFDMRKHIRFRGIQRP